MPNFRTSVVLSLLVLRLAIAPSVAQELTSETPPRELLQLPAGTAVTDVEFSADGQSIAIGASDGNVRVLPFGGGRQAEMVVESDKPINKVAFSPDGKRLAAAAFLRMHVVPLGDEAQLSDEAQQLEKLRSVKGSECVAFSPDGKLMAAGSRREPGIVVDTEIGERRFVIEPLAGVGPIDTGLYKSKTVAMDFSPDGNLLAVTTSFYDDELPRFHHLQVWDAKKGKLKFFFKGAGCDFSPSGDLLAYRSEKYQRDDQIVLLDLDTFLPVGFVSGESHHARFTPDGHAIATIGRQGLELWSVGPSEYGPRKWQRGRVLLHPSKVTSFAFPPDGSALVTGDEAGAVRLWKLGE